MLIDLIEKELNALIPVGYRILGFAIHIYEYGDYAVSVENEKWYCLSQRFFYIPKQKGFGHFKSWLKANRTDFINALSEALAVVDGTRLREK